MIAIDTEGTLLNWSVYLIKTKLECYYCGATTDVYRRFNEHQSNGKRCAKYLKGKQPLTLVWSKQHLTKQQAMQLEYQIKQLPREKKLLLISNNDTLISQSINHRHKELSS